MESFTPQPQAFFRRLLFSPDEPRLRSGWRVLLHLLLLLISLLVFSLPVVFLIQDGAANTAAPDETQVVVAEVLTLAAFAFATWIARRWLDHRSFRSLGFQLDTHVFSDILVGAAIPGLLMGVIYALESAIGWLQFETWAWQVESVGTVLRGLGVYLVVFILTAIGEELISRGYQLQNLAEGVGLRWALFLSALLFAALHLANPGADAASFIGLVAAGYFLAYAWVRTRKLWLSIGLHLGWNFFEGVVFGFPVSGLGVFGLIEQHATGPALITGGDFGPEAGLVVLPVLALGAWLIRLYTDGRRAEFDRAQKTEDVAALH
jgi:membrane protease YdiL (CAAX protease family)